MVWAGLTRSKNHTLQPCEIEKPKTTLKRLQRKIYQEILINLENHPAVHGFCKKRNCRSHALQHVGKHYVLLYDIQECFHSIGWPMVKSVFKRMGYPEAVSIHLTALCTHSVYLRSKRSIEATTLTTRCTQLTRTG